jgi:hypothetical protein
MQDSDAQNAKTLIYGWDHFVPEKDLLISHMSVFLAIIAGVFIRMDKKYPKQNSPLRSCLFLLYF